MYPTILVTGSEGFIGSRLIYKLCEEGYLVCGVSKGECRTNNLFNFIYQRADIRDHKLISGILAQYKPNVIIHCAAISAVDECEKNPQLCEEVNHVATQNLALCAKSINAHFIFLSSDFVFDGSTKWITEETVPNPLSTYGRSKWQAEVFISSNLKKYAIVRPVLVYGYSSTSNRLNFLTWVVESLSSGKNISVVNDQYRTPTYVEDLVKLLVCLIQNNATGIFNIGGANRILVYEFALEIAKIGGYDTSSILPTSSAEVPHANLRPRQSCVGSDPNLKSFGLECLTTSKGIELGLHAWNLR